MAETKKGKNGVHSEWSDFQLRAKPPESLRASVFSSVYADLQPSSQRVLAKLGIVHVVTSFATLSICPQFGVRLLGDGMGLLHYLMPLGEWGCALACGSFFLGASLLVASVLFSRAEWRKLRSQTWLAIVAMVLPSIGFFRFMDGEFFLGFSIAWLLGAALAGLVVVEGAWRWKSTSISKRVLRRT